MGEGIYTPTLLQHSKNAPPVFSEVKRLHQGYLVISLGKTVQLIHFYLDHMFHDTWQPSVRTFGRLRNASASSFIAPSHPPHPEGSRHHLRGRGPDQFPGPSAPGTDHRACYRQRERESDLTVSGQDDLRRTFGSRHLRKGGSPTEAL